MSVAFDFLSKKFANHSRKTYFYIHYIVGYLQILNALSCNTLSEPVFLPKS